eukprot:TRINITY_DN66762_c0_g1_i1.p1 TRINITY_DN66762_c0_g1~~TRINITY_DN66762_c0_g1_i1.p1  ORF type:complete len:307 (+),score=60.12 TRINITY_DN66762_c0_g1_i1:193-1113(+)
MPTVSDRSHSQAALEAAKAILKKWSSPLPPVGHSSSDPSEELASSDALQLPEVTPTLEFIFDVHAAIVALVPEVKPCLGDVGGLKLGWKNHALLKGELPAMYSPIFSGCFADSGDEVQLRRDRIFCAEAEYGFVLAERIEPRSKCYTADEVLKMIQHVELCIELCGVRVVEEASPFHFLADGMLNAGVIRGRTFSPESINLTSLSEVPVHIKVAGQTVCSGSGRENPLDSPLRSFEFVINEIACRRGLPLEAGWLVIAGHTCQAGFAGRPTPQTAKGLPKAQFKDGDEIVAEFEGLGTVCATLRDS